MKEAERVPRRKRRIGQAAKVLAGLVVLVGLGAVICRAAVGWVFPISSGSMEPAIATGESVFLLYGNSALERFDIVAFRDEASGAAIKRIVALPNDRFMITAGGDLRIRGGYVPDAPGRPAPTVIFDSARQDIGSHWRHGGSALDPWTQDARGSEADPDVWSLDGALVQPGADLGLLRFVDRVTDGALGDDGEYELGLNVVHDVIVKFEALILEPGGHLRVELNEQSDVFAVSIPVYGGDDPQRIILRRIRPRVPMEGGQQPVLVMGSAQVNVPVGEWVRVRMANIDNRVTFAICDVELRVDYDANTPLMNSGDGMLSGVGMPISIGERVKLGANGLPMKVRNLRVLRDFHVVPKGRFGSGQEITMGPDEIFVIGDASALSQDSRERGPIEVSRVIGTAKAVVRPFGSFRRL